MDGTGDFLTKASPLGWVAFIVLVGGFIAVLVVGDRVERSGRRVGFGWYLLGLFAVAASFFALVFLPLSGLLGSVDIVGIDVPGIVAVLFFAGIITGAMYLGYLLDKVRGKA